MSLQIECRDNETGDMHAAVLDLSLLQSREKVRRRRIQHCICLHQQHKWNYKLREPRRHCLANSLYVISEREEELLAI